MREKLLDPAGASDRAVDATLAPRLRTVRGLTAGLLDNGKPNASVLLTETGRELRRGHGVRDIALFLKGYFGTPVVLSPEHARLFGAVAAGACS
jgi:hypothetical protein